MSGVSILPVKFTVEKRELSSPSFSEEYSFSCLLLHVSARFSENLIYGISILSCSSRVLTKEKAFEVHEWAGVFGSFPSGNDFVRFSGIGFWALRVVVTWFFLIACVETWV